MTAIKTQNQDIINPVLVNVTRGGIVESCHRGSYAVVDINGTVKMSAGDIKAAVYPRSSVKILQALPAIAAGAGEKFNLTAKEISVMCASHGGEEQHVTVVKSILKKAGLTENDLECGAHTPTHRPSADALIAKGEAFSALHNNCSGKHAGMLLLALLKGFPTKGYSDPTHPVQQAILGVFESIMDCDLSNAPMDRDGCSAPTWAVPLENIAFGFAKIADPKTTLPDTINSAIDTLRSSVIEEPFMVAGTDRCCTKIMEVLKNKAFVKYGAEAVYTASLPEYGLGIALKIEDGGVRAVECALLRILEIIGVLSEAEKQQLMAFYKAPITNWNAFTVGHIEPGF